MMRPLVFHLDDELNEQLRLRRELQQPGEVRIIKPIAVIVWIEPDSPHAVDFAAATQVLGPIWHSRIDRSERDQHPRPVIAALRRESRVRSSDVLVKHSLEAADPGLVDLHGTKFVEESPGRFESVSPERPLAEMGIGVDRHGFTPFAVRIGVSSRFRLSLKISRLSASGTSAPCTLAI